ncbi:MAG: AarF/UbiB family protein, partial [Cyclobacteriaceae bacterium]
MKEQFKIPVTKVQRASKFVKTGARIGGNYLKHYSKKMLNPEISRDELDESNAEDIYESLSQLKGSALKVAQMLSMDKNALPMAYQDKFAMSQYSAPPLSYPLVVKTFRDQLHKSPDEVFDTFSRKAVNAASIGQVHKATRDGREYAVKVQYPGVADSISSDLRIVRPIAAAMFRINSVELDQYLGEVETKLKEETDYQLELRRSVDISDKCRHLEGLKFPEYFPELSSSRILVMDWLHGMHIKEWLNTEPSGEDRNRIGQALWDFYDYQIHELRQLHADPHPGNFLIT